MSIEQKKPIQPSQRQLAEERHLAMLLTVWQIPTLFANFIGAIANQSLVLWMEFIETLTVVLPALVLIGVVYFLRKNLRFRFNYGTGKIEAFTALICEVFDIGGLLLIITLAIMNLVHAHSEEKNLIFAIIMSAVGIAVTAVIQVRLKKLMARFEGKIIETFYVSIRKELFYGIISTITLVVTYFREHTIWSMYLSPIVCLVMAVPFLIIVSHHILHSSRDLLDETLEEELQLKILKILSEFFEEYKAVGDVRSRRSGEIIFIDIPLEFEADRTFEEIQTVTRRMEQRLGEEIGLCDVSIVICRDYPM